MYNVLDLAAYIYDRYKKENNAEIDEMKLHKLLYFTQRESFIRKDAPMFDSEFRGWKYGPVLLEVRKAYNSNNIPKNSTIQLTNNDKEIMDYVFEAYSHKSSWSLSVLSHGEYSWKESRKGVDKYATSNNIIKTENIRIDAQNLRERRNALKALKEAGMLIENK